MRHRKFAGTAVICAMMAAGLALRADGGDWPAYRHDATRCAFTTDQLKTPLNLQWAHVPRNAPSPAWPEPVTERHMMPFDYAPGVVAAGGLVYFASSTDHAVRALDLATGRPKWRFFTDAPVRFAPAVYDKKVYAASDDGYVYCLSAAEGRELWRFRAGPADERLLGNENMISRWPLRSGLVVDDGTVYFTAGMWPSEGVYTCALRAEDGKVLWKTEQRAKFAPQGYLAAGAKLLLAPTGRSRVWIVERNGGKARAGYGHSWAMVTPDLVVSGPPPFKANENLPIRGGPKRPPRAQSLTVWSTGPKPKPRRINGKGCAAVSDDTCYAAGNGKITAYALADFKKKWEIDHGRVFSLAVAGKGLVVGGDKTVAILSAAAGKKLWSAGVDGEARGLAVANGRLLVSTHTGRIVCFGPGKGRADAKTAAGAPPVGEGHRAAAALAGQIIKDTGITAGFCLLLGAGDGQLAMALARQSGLRIYCAEPDGKTVAAARNLLSAAGLYGSRITVHQIRPAALPYPDYFANLIVVVEGPGGGAKGFAAAELYRVLRPCGGTAYLVRPGGATGPSRTWITGPGLTRTRISAAAQRVVRGALPGAGQWTHLYADAGKSGSSGDRRVGWPMKVLWFGKPGPGRMMQRHWRGTAPVCTRGRMFILAQHSIIAADAYNGRELWSRPMPSIARRVVDIRGGNLVADGDSIYVATSDLCLRFDAETGRHRSLYRLPVARPRFVLSSPQTIPLGDLGKVEIRNTPEAVELKLAAADSTVTNADRKNNPARGDSWELFFDFRPKDRRTALPGPGAFQAIVVPATTEQPAASWHSGLWSKGPKARVTGTLGKDGSKTTVRISWAKIGKLTGSKPADFNFGVILNSSDDGKSLVRRTYRFANDAGYRLANCRARIIVDADRADRPTGAQAKLLKLKPHQRLAWGALIVSGDVIVGTTVAPTDSPRILALGRDFSSEGHDYTGPPVKRVLGNVGVESQAAHVFALGRDDGQPRWIYTAAEGIAHNAVAVWGGRVYLIDRTSDDGLAELKRRGEPPAIKASLVVLDLATGKRLWRIDQGLADYRQVRVGHGVLLAAGMKGMTAYSADRGAKLWSVATKQIMHHCSAFVRAPVITRKWVYDEPHAYDLRTGKIRTSGPPGPEAKAWRWHAGRGCGTISASQNMLFYRAGPPTLLDTTGSSGPHNFEGIRPGCYINMIPAGGLVLMPEASSGCGCPYNFQTTVALTPAVKRPPAGEQKK